jgi:RNA polymerase sigma factor (sigma-70 family)
MLNPRSITLTDRSDAELVGDCLAGSRDAFAEIVRRYQTLICSLAYSATGDLTRSEDLAQDTFIEVWRKLSELREPEKLRAWVCAIARHRIQDSIRDRYHEPTYKAATFNSADATPAQDDQPSGLAADKEEAAIVWQALAQMPETYREPLILFHREDQSVERVAALLELSEDAVRQRLVRGRKLLQAEVEAMVDTTLRRTAPGRVFTSSVMAALPVAGTAAIKVAAGTAAAAAKGVTGGGIAGILASVLASPLFPLGAILVERKRMLGYEAASGSLDERELLARHRRTVLRILVTVIAIVAIWSQWTKHLHHPAWWVPFIPVLTSVILSISVGTRIVATRCGLARIWARRGDTWVKRSWEYCSRWEPLGLPFVHIRLGFNPKWTAADCPVKAWIAIGHVAYGRLFAFGLVAIAPVSLGCFAIGIASIGFNALGALAFGFLAVGGIAVGGIVLGWEASGVFAFGLHAAYGLGAYARDFAVCQSGLKWSAAYAIHVSDAAAREFFAANEFFQKTIPVLHSGRRPFATLFLAISSPVILWEIIWIIMKGWSGLGAPPKRSRTPASDGTP